MPARNFLPLTRSTKWQCLLPFVLLGMVFVGPTSIQAANYNAADFYVRDLPRVEKVTNATYRMHSGLLPADDEDKRHIFFWLVQARNYEPREKLVIWLNGVPGIMDGMLLENGPYRIGNDSSARANPYTWNHHASTLYVDQPAGVGFSTTSAPPAKTEAEVSEQFAKFYSNFLAVFPEYTRAEVYLSGESYAGIYIPYIAKHFLTQQPAINLRGLMLGNPWMDPLRQYPAYIDFSVENNILSGKHLVDARKAWEDCQPILKETEIIKHNWCERILDRITDYSRLNGQACINMYDIRLRDPDNLGTCGMSWPPDLPNVQKYLQDPLVVESIHANPKSKWRECNSTVGAPLDGDPSPPSYKLLPDILSKLPVLIFRYWSESSVCLYNVLKIYSGDKDLICNWWGSRDMIESLEWAGSKGFGDAPSQQWHTDGQLAGTFRSARNLSFALIYNASHMVPVDQPAASLALLNYFIGATNPQVEMKFDTIPGILGGDNGAPVAPRQYYAGAVLLIMMFVALISFLLYKYRHKLHLPTSFPWRRGGTPRNRSVWRELDGDEEAMFDANEYEQNRGSFTH
ncbi:Alpha/Beta hydrolase protein [Phlyctochytrium arcticum]|nr:Alpha/Beta hydrolase protein [Phlyctochytrium arcticum]